MIEQEKYEKFTMVKGQGVSVEGINDIVIAVGNNATECNEGMSLMCHAMIMIARDNAVPREDFLQAFDLLWQMTEGEGKKH